MKKFFSAKKITKNDDLFAFLLNSVDSKLVRDRSQILKDIALHESLKDKGSRFGSVFVHTARTGGIADFCLSASFTESGNLEILILWNEISEHRLSKLSQIAGFLEKSANQNFSNEHILYELKKL